MAKCYFLAQMKKTMHNNTDQSQQHHAKWKDIMSNDVYMEILREISGVVAKWESWTRREAWPYTSTEELFGGYGML